jgi:KaiC/GvpD/RAD55 family RecA-like ATPase
MVMTRVVCCTRFLNHGLRSSTSPGTYTLYAKSTRRGFTASNLATYTLRILPASNILLIASVVVAGSVAGVATNLTVRKVSKLKATPADHAGLSTIGPGTNSPQPSSTSLTITNLIPYAAAVVTILSVAAFGFTRFQMGRKKRRTGAYSVLEKQAREAAGESPRAVVPTGVPPLDYLLNGGLPTGTANLLTSPACDERDLILRRVIETGINSGEQCVYLGKDAAKVEDLVASAPLRLKVLIMRADGRSADQSNVKVTGVDLSTINIDLMALLQSTPAEGSKRLCIDLLDDLLLLHKSTLTRRWLTQLLPRVKGLGCTVLATLNSQMHSSADLQAMIELFEGHVQLNEKAIDDKSRMVLRVQKMFRWKFVDTEAILDRNKIM